jgi:hypothetical protein
MAAGGSSKLIGVLKLTLEQLEQTEGLGSDNRALRELRSSILRTIAELELVHSSTASEASDTTPQEKGERQWTTTVIGS